MFNSILNPVIDLPAIGPIIKHNQLVLSYVLSTCCVIVLKHTISPFYITGTEAKNPTFWLGETGCEVLSGMMVYSISIYILLSIFYRIFNYYGIFGAFF